MAIFGLLRAAAGTDRGSSKNSSNYIESTKGTQEYKHQKHLKINFDRAHLYPKLRIISVKFEAAKNVVLNNILFALSWLRTKFNNSHFPYSCGLLSITLRGICRNFEKTASYNFKVEVGNRGPDHLASKLTFMS